MEQAGLDKIRSAGIVAVMRGMEASSVVDAARALHDGGVDVLEVTVDAPGAFAMIEKVVAALPSGTMIGAGTVLDAPTARLAISAGADFIFTPTLDLGVIETARRYGKLVVPGVMTPTEMLTAYSAGAACVKVFPASVLGPEYIKQVKAPLAQIPMIPTGGIDANNAAEYIAAGAVAVGVGSWLVPMDALREGRFQTIKERAQTLVAQVAAARRE